MSIWGPTSGGGIRWLIIEIIHIITTSSQAVSNVHINHFYKIQMHKSANPLYVDTPQICRTMRQGICATTSFSRAHKQPKVWPQTQELVGCGFYHQKILWKTLTPNQNEALSIKCGRLKVRFCIWIVVGPISTTDLLPLFEYNPVSKFLHTGATGACVHEQYVQLLAWC